MKKRPTVDHSVLSPSGRTSKRAREAAIKRTAEKLFPPGYWEGLKPGEQDKRLAEAKRLRLAAANLRGLAERGMSPKKFAREAARMESEADELTGGRVSNPKGRVPPHLRAYLFKKGHRRTGARKKKTRLGKRKPTARWGKIVAKADEMRRANVRKTNPRRALSGFRLFAKKGSKGPAMHFDGEKFSNNGRAKVFATKEAAARVAQSLFNQFAILRGYKFYALQPGETIPDPWARARNPK